MYRPYNVIWALIIVILIIVMLKALGAFSG